MWIFAYGSLMWNPSFKYEDKKIGSLSGYQRDFCIKTHYHRGNEKNYGLVLGLEENKNHSCKGILFKIKKNEIEIVMKKLDIRELSENSYLKTFKIIKTECNQEIKALIYISNNESDLYLNDHCKNKANVIKKAKGQSGFNIDYYNNTIKSLKSIGIKDEKIFNIELFF
jgi:cation transport protein ChaC